MAESLTSDCRIGLHVENDLVGRHMRSAEELAAEIRGIAASATESEGTTTVLEMLRYDKRNH
jgi:hypothetical protein